MPGKPLKTVLGFDYGIKRIGIATGQTITKSATPLVTIQSVKQQPDWKQIKAIINTWKPQALIVGIPYHTDGSSSKMTQLAEKFCKQLEQTSHLPVFKINETLTSVEAEQILGRNTKKTQHNKEEIDKIAAAIIVENWLDQQET